MIDTIFEYCFAERPVEPSAASGEKEGDASMPNDIFPDNAYEHSPLRESALRACIALFRNGGHGRESSETMKRRVVERAVCLSRMELDDDMALVAQDESDLLKELASSL